MSSPRRWPSAPRESNDRKQAEQLLRAGPVGRLVAGSRQPEDFSGLRQNILPVFAYNINDGASVRRACAGAGRSAARLRTEEVRGCGPKCCGECERKSCGSVGRGVATGADRRAAGVARKPVARGVGARPRHGENRTKFAARRGTEKILIIYLRKQRKVCTFVL